MSAHVTRVARPVIVAAAAGAAAAGSQVANTDYQPEWLVLGSADVDDAIAQLTPEGAAGALMGLGSELARDSRVQAAIAERIGLCSPALIALPGDRICVNELLLLLLLLRLLLLLLLSRRRMRAPRIGIVVGVARRSGSSARVPTFSIARAFPIARHVLIASRDRRSARPPQRAQPRRPRARSCCGCAPSSRR